jgi:hypothetical protein
MEKQKDQLLPQGQNGEESTPSDGKKQWQEPKLVFVEPKLTKHGELEKVTSGFFCVFEP